MQPNPTLTSIHATEPPAISWAFGQKRGTDLATFEFPPPSAILYASLLSAINLGPRAGIIAVAEVDQQLLRGRTSPSGASVAIRSGQE